MLTRGSAAWAVIPHRLHSDGRCLDVPGRSEPSEAGRWMADHRSAEFEPKHVGVREEHWEEGQANRSSPPASTDMPVPQTTE